MRLVSLVACASATFLVACPDTITIIECGPGQQPSADGASCVPYGSVPDAEAPDPGGEGDALVFPEFPTQADPGPESGPEPDPGGISDDGAPDPGPPSDEGPPGDEGTPDAVVQPGGVGAPCVINSDCEGGTCLDWPDGYCTQLECDQTGCPAGSVCASLPGGNFACLKACADASECTPGVQGCKILDPEAGQGTCHGVEGLAEGVGGLCESAADCLGAAVCMSIMPGGYCGVTPCTGDSCPVGSSCVKFDGTPICMRDCEDDFECGGIEGAERKCEGLKDVDKAPVDVCVSAAAGKGVGELCVSGFECTSQFCQILGDGRCSQSDTPCFTDGDCPSVEFCTITSSSKVGICTSECSVSQPCPGASFCVGQPGGLNTGFCRPPCTGVGDTSCDSDNGFACVFGYALGDSSGQGRYLCQLQVLGTLGQTCEGGADCDSGLCAPEGVSPAVCADYCQANQYCPFPGSCVASPDGPATCYKSCFSPLDCPGGLSCVQPAGSIRKVCQ